MIMRLREENLELKAEIKEKLMRAKPIDVVLRIPFIYYRSEEARQKINSVYGSTIKSIVLDLLGII